MSENCPLPDPTNQIPTDPTATGQTSMPPTQSSQTFMGPGHPISMGPTATGPVPEGQPGKYIFHVGN